MRITAQEPALRTVYADLHLHIGRTSRGEPVKISGSRDLTFRNIAHEASNRKGIGLLGVIDAHSPGVQRDIADLLERGEMTEIAGGGVRYKDTTLVLGAEIEVRDEGMASPAHYLVYMPDFEAMRALTRWLERHMRNVQLSSQRLYATGRVLQEVTAERSGLFVPAHLFTPHRSLLGSSSRRIADALDPERIDAVELGLSADTAMAEQLPELRRYPYLTNSDAHSLAKIGREYNALRLAEASFEELRLALRGERGRGIAANYGLDPRLGKYHRTRCMRCGTEAGAADQRCAACGSAKLVRGVAERIAELAASAGPAAKPDGAGRARPPYVHQVPLEFVPGVGPRMLDRLLERFGTEMAILHDVSEAQLLEAAGPRVGELIALARSGGLRLHAGGGGVYGSVARE
ncbi:TIGR00375 family protein [Paenibacillus sp. IB182496]|uniref:TIGR00375 family protein n=1 Tax=Paenibacillus sabuli TaxID=2772509 RepID=A0A927BXJ6_9BACL|nr:PHP-associated domain-containing protein [Paenibacillus sabuli]MBD2847324.1 TIGR00375 family protein [Paenibacillus sabuli]